MRTGASIPLSYAVLGLVLLTTALAVIVGSQTGIGDIFSVTEGGTSQADCDLQLQRVQNGEEPPSDVTTECRNTLTAEEWENLRKSYEQAQIGDILTGG